MNEQIIVKQGKVEKRSNNFKPRTNEFSYKVTLKDLLNKQSLDNLNKILIKGGVKK